MLVPKLNDGSNLDMASDSSALPVFEQLLAVDDVDGRWAVGDRTLLPTQASGNNRDGVEPGLLSCSAACTENCGSARQATSAVSPDRSGKGGVGSC